MKVRLRPLREEDAHTSIRWRADPEVWRYTLAAGRAAPPLERELEWIRAVIADPAGRRFAVEADGVYVGNVYLTGIDGEQAEFHVVIGERSCWGKGVAREATVQALQYAWGELGLARVHLIVHPANEAALRIYRSLGFSHDGERDGFIVMSLCNPNGERERKEISRGD